MNVARIGLVGLVASAFALGCSDRAPPPPPAEQAALGGETAARVGTDVIPVLLVAKVAAAQHIAPREASRHLVDDAICANAARARGLDRQLPLAWRLVAARARFTADRLLADAKGAGPPNDSEIAELTARYWREVDRPVMLRTVHVVAQRPEQAPGKAPDPAAEPRARALADELKAAVASAKDADDFIAKAKAVPHPGVTVTAEQLGPFAEDGSTLDGNPMDATFAKGTFAFLGRAAPGETSGIVESQFGWHVVRLVERLPEERMPLEARRLAFTDEVYTQRAAAATQARRSALLATTPVQISTSAELLMRTLFAPAASGPTP